MFRDFFRRQLIRRICSTRKTHRRSQATELLEPRSMLTTFVVNVASDAADADPQDGIIDTDLSTPGEQVSLRAAIAAANAAPGADVVQFQIPNVSSPTINITSALPTMTNSVTLDASTQAGGRVTLDGGNGNYTGLSTDPGTVTLRNLTVTRFGQHGLRTTHVTSATHRLLLDNVTLTDNGQHGIFGEGLSTIEIQGSAVISQNGQWGIATDGFVDVEGAAFTTAEGPKLQVTSNDLGGIRAGLDLEVRRTSITGNGVFRTARTDGHGLQAGQNATLAHVSVTGNHRDGVNAGAGIRVLPTTIAGWTNTFASNLGSGLIAVGGSGREIVVEGAIGASNNAEYGLHIESGSVLINSAVDGAGRGTGVAVTQTISHITSNGFNGVNAGGGSVVINNADVSNNGGRAAGLLERDGLHADGTVSLNGVQVLTNRGHGISAGTRVLIGPGTASNFSNEIRGNQKSGIFALGGSEQGLVLVRGGIKVTENRERGIDLVAGTVAINVSLFPDGRINFERFSDEISDISLNSQNGIHAGGFNGLVFANLTEFKTNGRAEGLDAPQRHGISTDGSVRLRDVKVVSNGGDGVHAGTLGIISRSAFPNWVNELANNDGSGIRLLGGVDRGLMVQGAIDVTGNREYGLAVEAGVLIVNGTVRTDGAFLTTPFSAEVSHLRNNGFSGIFAGGSHSSSGVVINRAEVVHNGHLGVAGVSQDGVRSETGVTLADVSIRESREHGVRAGEFVDIKAASLPGGTNEIVSNQGSGIHLEGRGSKTVRIASPVNITNNVRYAVDVLAGKLQIGDAASTAVSNITSNLAGGLKAPVIEAHAVQFSGNGPGSVTGANSQDVTASVSAFLRAPDVSTVFDVRNLTVPATLQGGAQADTLIGGAGHDVIAGFGGNDVLYGFGGNDNLAGGAGHDRLFGVAGNDALFGGDGTDLLIGGVGDDVGDGLADLSVTMTATPIAVHKGDVVRFQHSISNQGPDWAIDAGATGQAIGVIAAPSLAESFGEVILDPVTGASTGVRGLPPSNRPVTVSGTAQRVGSGGYVTSVGQGDSTVMRDPVPGNNRASATVRVKAKFRPGEEVTRGERTGGGGTSSGNNSMRITTLSGNGNYVAFSTNRSVFDVPTNTSSAMNQIGLGDPILVSINFAGTSGGNDLSGSQQVDGDGSHVAFNSLAGDLIEGFVDNNGATTRDENGFVTIGKSDVFVRDINEEETRLVSVNLAGTGGANHESLLTAITDDGHLVFFTSKATDLVASDPNGNVTDLFVRDLSTQTTEMVTLTNDGSPLTTDSLFVRQITADGRFILFETSDPLVPEDTNSGFNASDLYLHDRQTGTSRLVSVGLSGNAVASIGESQPRVTPDGRHVLFANRSTALVVSGVTDTNAREELFVRDMEFGTTSIITVARDGITAVGVRTGSDIEMYPISDNGRFVLFDAFIDGSVAAAEFPDAPYRIYVRDRQTGLAEPVTLNAEGTGAGNGFSQLNGMSRDGRFVLFRSDATDLVTGITDNNASRGGDDVFVRDLLQNTTSLITVNHLGTGTTNAAINDNSVFLSDDGTRVYFMSEANDFNRHGVQGNFGFDIFSSSDHVALKYIAPNGNGADDLTLRRNGDDLEIFDNRTQTVVARRAADDTLLVIVQGSDNEVDTLKVDFSGGTITVDGGVHFDGGKDTSGSPQDRIELLNGTFALGTYDLTGSDDGVLRLDDFALIYDHHEQIVDRTSVQTRVINNDIAGDQQMTLEDDGTANDGLSRVVFTGLNAPPALIIANPTEALEFNTFAGEDSFTESSRDAGLIVAVEDNVRPRISNAAPTFTAGPDQVVSRSAGRRTVANWASNISAGPASETAQTLTFSVIAADPALFAEQPAVSSTGTLTFTPRQDASGTTSVSVRLHDNGGTDSGGLDSSAEQSFFITVRDFANSVSVEVVNGRLEILDDTADGTVLTLRADPVTSEFVVTSATEDLGSDSATAVSEVRIPMAAVTGGVRADLGAGDDRLTVLVNVRVTILGGDGNDTLDGKAMARGASLQGGNGNDTLVGGLFADVLLGEEGDDVLLAGGGDDTLSGGLGNDTLRGHQGRDEMSGGLGNDLLTGDSGGNILVESLDASFTLSVDTSPQSTSNVRLTGTGQDVLRDTFVGARLTGGDSNNQIDAQFAGIAVTLHGGGGNDLLIGGVLTDSLIGGAGHDTLLGGANHDTLEGGLGADVILGHAGNDLLSGGLGDDVIDAGAGSNILREAEDVDMTLTADRSAAARSNLRLQGVGNDFLRGQFLRARLIGGASNNRLDAQNAGIRVTLSGGAGNDILIGGAFDDVLTGDAGHDTILGAAGDDVIFGGVGNDFLRGSGGGDTILGGDGNDTVLGEAGADTLLGEAGDDRIEADTGTLNLPDRVTGGGNAQSVSPNDIVVASPGEIDNALSLNLAVLLSAL